MFKRITIGREKDNDIRVPDYFDTVSNKHADIEVTDDNLLYIVDHSRNGTIVNGIIIHNSRIPISYGDKITLSKSYDLSWTLIVKLIPEINSDRFTFKDDAKLHHARETEILNQDRNFGDSFAPPYNSVQNREIELAKKKWSWGGFLLSWIWALGHACWWPFVLLSVLGILSFFSVTLFPSVGFVFLIIQSLVQIVINIYLGVKGNSIAWINGCFENVKHFQHKEHRWTIAGIIFVTICFFMLIIMALLFFVFCFDFNRILWK